MIVNYALIFWLGWGKVYWGLNRPPVQCVATVLINASICIAAYFICGPMRNPQDSRVAFFSLGAAVLAACLIFGDVALAGFLHSADEYAYLFEAQTFQQGRLWNPPPPLGQAQTTSYIWVVGSKWVAQYAPGWPGFLALIGLISPSYILAPALLLVVTMFGIVALVRERAGRQEALLAALLFALTPFAVFNGGSLYSHTMAACIGVLVMLASRAAVEQRSLRFALVVGGLIGLLSITRNASAVVIACAVVLDQFRKPGWFSRFILIGLGGLPFVAGLLWFQYTITGNALMPVYWFAGRKVDHLYFDLGSIEFGVATALKNFMEITLYTNPVFVTAWAIAVATLWQQKRLTAADLIYPFGIILFLFYPLAAGDRFGPRYNFDFWPTAVATIGAAVPAVAHRAREVYRQALLTATMSGASVTIVLGFYWHAVTMDTFDAMRVIETARLHNAVVCLKGVSGKEKQLNPYNFPRNGIRSDGEVIKLRCEATSPMEIHAAYPGRTVWTYVREADQPTGHLVLRS
jgi:hypothetical protein